MYDFILGGVLLPVAPSKLDIKTGNKNKTVELVSIGEVNILKDTGLMEYAFEVLLPGKPYPFMTFKDGFKEPFFYLGEIKKLKDEKEPFSFEVLRLQPDGSQLLSLTRDVSLESYTIRENAGEEGDFWVGLTLKEFRMPKVKVVKTEGLNEEGKTLITETTERDHKAPAESYTVVSGDSLWAIAKRELNDGSRYAEIAELNDINDPNRIHPGQVLRLPS